MLLGFTRFHLAPNAKYTHRAVRLADNSFRDEVDEPGRLPQRCPAQAIRSPTIPTEMAANPRKPPPGGVDRTEPPKVTARAPYFVAEQRTTMPPACAALLNR